MFMVPSSFTQSDVFLFMARQNVSKIKNKKSQLQSKLIKSSTAVSAKLSAHCLSENGVMQTVGPGDRHIVDLQ